MVLRIKHTKHRKKYGFMSFSGMNYWLHFNDCVTILMSFSGMNYWLLMLFTPVAVHPVVLDSEVAD